MSVTVIGVDAGELPSGAENVLRDARLVVGARRHLDTHAPESAKHIEIGELDPAMSALSSLSGGETAVVLVSGDPGFFGAVRLLRERGIHCSVLPATSSVQQLMARVGRSWDDASVVTANNRELRQVLNLCRARESVIVLTTPGAGPAQLGSGLEGWRRTMVVAQDLGSAHEEVVSLEPGEAAQRTWHEPNIVLVLGDPDAVPSRGWLAGGEPTPPEGGWALPEEEFAHRGGGVTSAETRAVALARLAPRPGSLVWDVGAGAGAVAVECARMGAATIAVESDPVQCARIVANAGTYGVNVRTEEAEAPKALRGLPRPDAVFVGCGGSDVITSCAYSGARRIVVALTALDRVTATRDALRGAGYSVHGTQLSASRLATNAEGGSRMSSTDPVLLLCGERDDSEESRNT